MINFKTADNRIDFRLNKFLNFDFPKDEKRKKYVLVIYFGECTLDITFYTYKAKNWSFDIELEPIRNCEFTQSGLDYYFWLEFSIPWIEFLFTFISTWP